MLDPIEAFLVRFPAATFRPLIGEEAPLSVILPRGTPCVLCDVLFSCLSVSPIFISPYGFFLFLRHLMAARQSGLSASQVQPSEMRTSTVSRVTEKTHARQTRRRMKTSPMRAFEKNIFHAFQFVRFLVTKYLRSAYLCQQTRSSHTGHQSLQEHILKITLVFGFSQKKNAER